MKSRLSVIIVTYNNEDTITGCLDAILGSDYENLDVIVVDNASKDSTRKKLSESKIPLSLFSWTETTASRAA